MTLSALINRPCTLTLRSDSGTDDDYGNEINSETTVDTVCEAQPTRVIEPDRAGDLSDEDWTAFFLPSDGAALDSADAVTIDGLGTFEVVGRPPTMRNPRTGQDVYVEVKLRQTEGPE